MKISSGIEGVDELSLGGFNIGGVNLVSGVAGTGKSFFAIHFLWDGLKNKDEVLYVSLEEEKASVERQMADMGIDTSQKHLHIIDLGALRSEKLREGDAMVGFGELREFLRSFLAAHPVKRVVIDSISAVGIYYRSVEKLREELFAFVRFLRSQKVTTLLTSEALEGGTLTRFGVEQFLADSFIVLGLEESKGELRRTFIIRKMRYTDHDTTKRPFHISKKGIEVFVGEKVA